MYFAHCIIDDSSADKIAQLRPSHLAYVKEFIANIAYGGVCGDAEVPYRSICLFLDVENEQQARDFIANDPYSSVYQSVDIQEFSQKIPFPVEQ